MVPKRQGKERMSFFRGWRKNANTAKPRTSFVHALVVEKSAESDPVARQQAEIKAQQLRQLQLFFAVASLGCAVGGVLFFPPLLVLSLPGALYTTRLSYRSAQRAVQEKQRLTVDVISTLERGLLLVTGNWFYASVSSFNFALNKYILARVKNNSKAKLADAFRQQVRFAWIEVDGVDMRIPIEQLQPGDCIVVNAGEIIPVDGQVTRGMATVDQHLLTGEAAPIDKGAGEAVFAMTTVLSGRIYLQVEKAGAATVANQIAQLLEETFDAKTAMQLRIEEISDQTVTPVMGLSVLALPFFGPLAAIAVLQSHFKYKGNITTSLSILSYLRIATTSGVLVKDGRTFELLNRVDTVVFDKTGTLTQEQPHIACIHICGAFSADQVLLLAATAEVKQSHPIARAILQEAAARDLVLPAVEDATYQVGYGLSVIAQGQALHVGSARYMAVEAIPIPPALQEVQATAHDQGHSMVWVALERRIVGAIELKPTVRPEAKALMQTLRQRGIKNIYIISGDHAIPTQRLAEELGVDGYYAETLPAQKAQLVQNFQAQGQTICYVGDGLNDAVALKSATVSISLRGASALATDTAQVVLLEQDLSQIATLFALAQELQNNMKLTLSAVALPSLYSLSGVFLGGFGLGHAFVLTQLGFFAGVAVALLPLWQHRARLVAPTVAASPVKRPAYKGVTPEHVQDGHFGAANHASLPKRLAQTSSQRMQQPEPDPLRTEDRIVSPFCEVISRG